MKFLTWVSIHCVLSVIPNVTYFKLKCIFMLYVNKNVGRFVQKSRSVVHNNIPKEGGL